MLELTSEILISSLPRNERTSRALNGIICTSGSSFYKEIRSSKVENLLCMFVVRFTCKTCGWRARRNIWWKGKQPTARHTSMLHLRFDFRDFRSLPSIEGFRGFGSPPLAANFGVRLPPNLDFRAQKLFARFAREYISVRPSSAMHTVFLVLNESYRAFSGSSLHT